MAHDDDERLWAPDAEVTFEYRESTPFVSDERNDSSLPSRRPQMRWWRRSAFVASAVCVVVVALVAVAAITSDDRNEPTDAASEVPDSGAASGPTEFETLPTTDAGVVGGEERGAGDDVVLGVDDLPLRFAAAPCLRHRLPRSIDPRWVIDLPSEYGSGGQESIGDEVVVLPIRRSSSVDSPAAAVELLALDLIDGSERWRVDLGLVAEPPEIVDVFSGVAVVRLRDEPPTASTLVGISERSGDELWRQVIEDGVEVLADPADGLLVVHDAEVDDVPDDDALDDDQHGVSWFDPTTFTSTNSVVGRFLGLGVNGSVTVVRDGVVSVVRGRSGVVVEATWPENRDPLPFTVLGSGVLVAEEASLDLNETNPSGGWLTRPLDLNGSARIDRPTRIILLDAMGDSSVVVGSPGAVHGGDVTADSIDLRWRRSGTAIGGGPSDRGRTMLLRRDGIAVTDVIDASTGRTIVALPRPPVVTLYANGVLVAGPRDSDGPAVRTAYDLDGRELWTLAETIATVVGDRVVVAVTLARELVADGSRPPRRVTAYGRVPDEPARCDGVMQD